MQRIAMIFGGRSVEHEVSVLTAHQAMAAMPKTYEIVPVYISKHGAWYTGAALRNLQNFRDLQALEAQLEPIEWSLNPARPGFFIQRETQKKGLFGGGKETQRIYEPIDVAFPLIHGSHGEDGTLQGVFELSNIAYTGCDVTASALAIHKGLTKQVLRAAGLPVLDDVLVQRQQWKKHTQTVLDSVTQKLKFPLFVKPARLGSSIGVTKVTNVQELTFALDVAATYDSVIIVEPYQANIMEINCSVLGVGADARASVCEQPINNSGVLSYEDKYMSGAKNQGMQGAQRIIPAPLSAEQTAAIQEAALKGFAALGASGVARIDFLHNQATGTFVINEINTLPGSLSFYLWEATELTFDGLLKTMIDQAVQRQRDKQQSTYSMSTNLLSNNSLAGSKSGGVKQAVKS